MEHEIACDEQLDDFIVSPEQHDQNAPVSGGVGSRIGSGMDSAQRLAAEPAQQGQSKHALSFARTSTGPLRSIPDDRVVEAGSNDAYRMQVSQPCHWPRP